MMRPDHWWIYTFIHIYPPTWRDVMHTSIVIVSGASRPRHKREREKEKKTGKQRKGRGGKKETQGGKWPIKKKVRKKTEKKVVSSIIIQYPYPRSSIFASSFFLFSVLLWDLCVVLPRERAEGLSKSYLTRPFVFHSTHLYLSLSLSPNFLSLLHPFLPFFLCTMLSLFLPSSSTWCFSEDALQVNFTHP